MLVSFNFFRTVSNEKDSDLVLKDAGEDKATSAAIQTSFVEASTRVAQARKNGKKGKKNKFEELKKEIEMVFTISLQSLFLFSFPLFSLHCSLCIFAEKL